MSIYLSNKDVRRINRTLIGCTTMLAGAFLFGVNRLPQSDVRQAAMNSIHNAPRGTFEIVQEIGIGSDITVLAYKDGETFYPEPVKTALGEDGRRICSDIFLYYAQIRDGKIHLHYEPDQPTIINPGTSVPLWRNGSQAYVPEAINYKGQIMTVHPIAQKTICRIEAL